MASDHHVTGVPNMTMDEFRKSLIAAQPPAELAPALVGLWWDAKGDWTRAHESILHTFTIAGLAVSKAGAVLRHGMHDRAEAGDLAVYRCPVLRWKLLMRNLTLLVVENDM